MEHKWGKSGKSVQKLFIFVICYLLMLSTTSIGAAESSNNEQPYIPVLMYHHFEHGVNDRLTADPNQFREQLQYLKDQGYETIHDQDIIDFLHGKKELPPKPLMITIDDGYLSNYELAFPILQELEMKATIYIVVHSRNDKPGDLKHFSWEQAQEMVDSGLISIQSHTYDSHYRVETIDGDSPALIARYIKEDGEEETMQEYQQRVKKDLHLSKQLIEEHLDQEVVSLAYPYGAFNADVETIAIEVGYQTIHTVRQGINFLGDNPYQINRITVPGYFSGERIEAEIQKHAKKQKKYNQGKVYMQVNDRFVFPEQDPFIHNERVYVPLRFLVQELGGNITWNSQEQRIELDIDTEELHIDVHEQTLHTSTEQIDTPLIQKQGRYFVPVREVAQAIGAQIQWHHNFLGHAMKLNINHK